MVSLFPSPLGGYCQGYNQDKICGQESGDSPDEDLEPGVQGRDGVMAEVNELMDVDLGPGVRRHHDGVAKLKDLIDKKKYPGVQRRDGLAEAKELIDDSHFRYSNVRRWRS